MKRHDARDIEATIAQARSLVADARKTLGEAQRYFAANGIDAERCLAEIRQLGGAAAVREAQAEVEATLRSIDDEIQRSKVQPRTSSVARRVALRDRRI